MLPTNSRRRLHPRSWNVSVTRSRCSSGWEGSGPKSKPMPVIEMSIIRALTKPPFNRRVASMGFARVRLYPYSLPAIEILPESGVEFLNESIQFCKLESAKLRFPSCARALQNGINNHAVVRLDHRKVKLHRLIRGQVEALVGRKGDRCPIHTY
jgi:hypothetical protein